MTKNFVSTRKLTFEILQGMITRIKEQQLDWMRLDSALKNVVPDISRPKKSRHFLMHRMSVKLPDNFQMCEHSWPCRFHINNNNYQYFFFKCWGDFDKCGGDFTVSGAIWPGTKYIILCKFIEQWSTDWCFGCLYGLVWSSLWGLRIKRFFSFPMFNVNNFLNLNWYLDIF